MSVSQAGQALLDGDTWPVIERTAAAYAQYVEPGFDTVRALADADAVRELVRLLAANPALRRAVLRDGGPQHKLLDVDDKTAGAAADAALTAMRHRQDEARRTKKAARRGTADERRQARHLAELSKARQDRATALNLVADRDETLARLRTTVSELDDALAAETRRVEDAEAQRDAARLEVTTLPLLAGHLLTALDTDDSLAHEAATAIELPPGLQTGTLLGSLRKLLAEIANPTASRHRRASRAIAVDMLGGGVEVGGSCALVTADDTRILIDAGTRPKAPTPAQSAPPRLAQALTDRIDAIVITHAHADHAGWVPAILAAHPQVPVYATAATADLLPTMWADAARIYRREAGAGAPFTETDARAAVRRVRPVEYGRDVHIGDLTVSLFPAGHIVGAAGVTVTHGTGKVVVTGDVSGAGQRTVGGYDIPAAAIGADLLVMESTYGHSPNLAPRERVVAEFLKDISVTVSGGGRVLVPAFALGRAQEIALLVADNLPHVPVLIDGMARDITEIFEGRPGPDGKPLRILTDNVALVPRGRTSDTARHFTSGVIITTSGMLSGGPAITWGRRILPDPNSAVMLVGYQDPNSPGSALQRLAETTGTYSLPNDAGQMEPVDVNAKVKSYQLGAHASSDELIALASEVRAKTTMLVHGDDAARAALADRLNARHMVTVDAGAPWRAGS